MGLAPPIRNRGARKGWCGQHHHAPTALAPAKTRYPLYSRLGGPRNQSGRHGKSRPNRDSIPTHGVSSVKYD